MNDINLLFFTFFKNDYFVVSILHLLRTHIFYICSTGILSETVKSWCSDNQLRTVKISLSS